MFSIPNIPINYKIKIIGKISKIYQTLIKEIVKFVLYKEKIKNSNITVEVVICSEDKIKEHNKQYMNKNYTTDILSISYKEDKETEKNPILKNMLGSILICPKVIKEDSEELKKDYTKHLTHLMIHGTLHLLGYNHDENEERNRMELKEVNLLSFLGIESPYL